MEVMLDNDFSLWGLTEAELEALQRPPSSPPNYDLELAEYRVKQEAAASRKPQSKATRRHSSGQAAEDGDGPTSNAATPAPARAGGGLMVTSLSKPVPGEGRKAAAAADPFESSLWSEAAPRRRDDDDNDDGKSMVSSPPSAAISGATSGARSVARHLRPDAGDDPDL
jgi:hypothetical protein